VKTQVETGITKLQIKECSQPSEAGGSKMGFVHRALRRSTALIIS
jgi:hypothetical protein